jgi:glycosyltransferase A (GT-A) superfamily protein (DUF2064 family)
MARRARRHRTVIVFMRAPILGRVKSRLAREIGTIAAWQFYRRSSQRLLRRLKVEPTWSVVIAWADPPSAGDKRAHTIWQGPGDIGQRMEHCLAQAPPGPVVLLGADIPGVRSAHIRNAFAALRSAPLVFGPARDGGFWLVGARNGRQLPRPLFGAGIRWSSTGTLGDVTARLRVPYALADQLADVDYAEDLPPSASLTGFPGR